jgi:Zn-dependent peptidase ImmA (M78 family)
MFRNKIKCAADKLTADCLMPPINAHSIAKSAGLQIDFVKFHDRDQDVSGVCDFESSRIFVNSTDDTDRQTFTIAYMLGHWTLFNARKHNDLKFNTLYKSFSPTRSLLPKIGVNHKASKFAAYLLIPEKFLKSVQNSSIPALANCFGVEESLIEFRLHNTRKLFSKKDK